MMKLNKGLFFTHKFISSRTKYFRNVFPLISIFWTAVLQSVISLLLIYKIKKILYLEELLFQQIVFNEIFEEKMKKASSVMFLLFFLFLSVSSAQTTEDLIKKNSEIDTNKVILPWAKHPQIAETIVRLLTRYHYRRQPLNDSLSAVILNTYLKRLDNQKMYFLQKDIDSFSQYKDELDDDLYSGNIMPPYKIFNLFKTRLTDRIKLIDAQLNKGFDFTLDEYFSPDREDSSWAKTESQLNQLWRKKLKNDALSLILNGKKKAKAIETLRKRFHRFHKLILQYDAEDVFQLFMNSVCYTEDPHTTYFSPKASENFKIGMSLSLEGIGASLSVKDDYTTIVRIIPGGPAARSGKLKVDDKIVAVAQGRKGEWVDVIGWRIDDVVQLIRGKKGTIVRLQIIHADSGPDAPPTEIELVRDKIKLEDQAAKAKVIKIKEKGKTFNLGVITIPEFYTNFGGSNKGKDISSTSQDVRRLLDSLKTEKIQGLIIDLRSDGGGSLQEAIQLTGLFIKQGPVVQIRSVTGKVDVEDDPDPAIVYDGPMMVMVNKYSASASEIFSGAIQDYGRGIIVGGQTYGKGTVQNMIDLRRIIPETPDQKIGALKLTIAKFYRITGSSTQEKGVIPDIKYPAIRDPKVFGEIANPSALPWDTIAPAQFVPFANLTKYIPILNQEHSERIKNNVEFKYIKEDIKEYYANKKKTKFSLNLKVRRAEREKRDKIKAERKKERKKNNPKKDDKKKDLKTDDPFLEETGHVLADFIILQG